MKSKSAVAAARSKPFAQAPPASKQSKSLASSYKLAQYRETPIYQASATATASRTMKKVQASQSTSLEPQSIQMKQSEDGRSFEGRVSFGRHCKRTLEQQNAEVRDRLDVN